MMVRLLEVTGAAADTELRRLANKLEALLLREFPDEIDAAKGLAEHHNSA